MKILISAGGTAGHLNPALALAEFMKSNYNDVEILFVGTPNKIESTLVPEKGFEFKAIKVGGFQRKLNFGNLWLNVSNFLNLIFSFKKSRDIIKDFKPDVVIGFGGYVSFPILTMAVKMKIKTAIHEQNSFPGIANKLLAEKVDLVMLSNIDAKARMKVKNRVELTGLPVRGELFKFSKTDAKKMLGLSNEKALILSFGGSLGANAVNEAVKDLMLLKKDDNDCIFFHSTGKNKDVFLKELSNSGLNSNLENSIKIFNYINNMELCMPAADVVVSRAGASSLSEIEALGKASILIPSPNVSENHQYFNARSLSDRNAAILIEEKDLNGEILKNKVDKLIKNSLLRKKIEENAKELYKRDSLSSMATLIINLCKE